MSPLGFVATLAAGATLGVLTAALARAGDDGDAACPMCHDNGAHVIDVDGQAPTKVWCRACELGTGYAARARDARGERNVWSSTSFTASTGGPVRVPLFSPPGHGAPVRHIAATSAQWVSGSAFLRGRCGAWLLTTTAALDAGVDVASISEWCPRCEAAS